MLLITACAQAFTGSDYPAWDGASTPEDSLYGGFGDHKLLLEFDPSQEYSIVEKGSIQACFFAFDSAQQNYLEMYLILPDDLHAGDVYNAQDGASNASISLYEVSKDTEVLYFAGQVAGVAYPQGSDYEIHIESATLEGNAFSVNGRLSAQLSRIEGAYITDELLKLDDISFNFTLPMSAAAPSPTPKSSDVPQSTPLPQSTPAPRDTAQPEFTLPPYFMPTPRPTMDPHPAFTLPPDYRVI